MADVPPTALRQCRTTTLPPCRTTMHHLLRTTALLRCHTTTHHPLRTSAGVAVGILLRTTIAAAERHDSFPRRSGLADSWSGLGVYRPSTARPPRFGHKQLSL